MARATTGTVFESRGKWYARVSLGGGKRPAYCLPWCSSERDATARLAILAKMARDLRSAPDAAGIAERVLTDAASATTKPELAKVVELVARVVGGRLAAASVAAPGSTFGEVAKAWTSGELAKRFPDHVKAKRTASDDEQRLRCHVLPMLRDVPMAKLTLERLDAVMAALPEGLASATRRQVAQSISSVIKFSVYPLRLITVNPIPRGWLPRVGNCKKQEILLTSEHDAFLGSAVAPIVVRLFAGFLAREGMRHGEAEGLTWADLDLDHGMVRLDANKTDDPRSWALRPGTTRALKHWRKMLGGDPKGSLFVDGKAPLRLRADDYRDHLRAAGIARGALHKGTAATKPTGLHALRALFVTEALARGESESWVCDRTGHKSSQMIATYKRRARTFIEAKLPPLAPLDVALGWAPQLAEGAPELSAPVANRREPARNARKKAGSARVSASSLVLKSAVPKGRPGSSPGGATHLPAHGSNASAAIRCSSFLARYARGVPSTVATASCPRRGRRAALAALVLGGAAAGLCFGGCGDDAGTGAGGGAAQTSTNTATVSASVSAAGSTTGTSGAACDDGTPHTLDSPECGACLECSIVDACAAELAAYQADPNAGAWSECVFGDGMSIPGCPDDDPMTPEQEFLDCLAMCDTAWPGVQDLYIALLSCAVCVECPNNCDAATACT